MSEEEKLMSQPLKRVSLEAFLKQRGILEKALQLTTLVDDPDAPRQVDVESLEWLKNELEEMLSVTSVFSAKIKPFSRKSRIISLIQEAIVERQWAEAIEQLSKLHKMSGPESNDWASELEEAIKREVNYTLRLNVTNGGLLTVQSLQVFGYTRPVIFDLRDNFDGLITGNPIEGIQLNRRYLPASVHITLLGEGTLHKAYILRHIDKDYVLT